MPGQIVEHLFKHKIFLFLALIIMMCFLHAATITPQGESPLLIADQNPLFPTTEELPNITKLPELQTVIKNLTDNSEDKYQKAEYDQRVNRMKEICNTKYKKDNGTEFQFGDKILTSLELQLSYCWTPKVGTSTWFKYFMELAQLPESLDKKWTPWMYMPKLFSIPAALTYEEKRAIFVKTFSIVFVRHPFLRLVSSYQDKVIDSKYRNFRNLTAKYNSSSSDLPVIHNGQKFPNFSQFVEFVLDVGHKYDVHIQSFSSRCGICTLPYDFIGKMETFDKDMKYIIKKVGLEEQITELIHLRSSSGGSTEEKAMRYFSTIERSKIEQLYEMYKQDFDLFGFSPNAYIQIASRNKI